MGKYTAMEAAEHQNEQRRLEANMRYFLERWAPKDRREAAEFGSELYSLVQQIYRASAEPFAKQFGDAMMLAAPLMQTFINVKPPEAAAKMETK